MAKKRRLKIAQIAPLWFPIPPKKYGGTERIIYYLAEELVKRGHQVTLFASDNSKTRAKLISVTKKGLIEQGIPWHDWLWNNFNHSRAFEMAKNFDVLHCHWNILGAFFQRFVKTPVLHTFHNTPISTDHRWKIFDYYKKDLNVVFLSKNQQKRSPIKFKKEWVVYNGIDISKFFFKEKSDNFLLWVGRICPDKAPDIAIKVAKKLGMNLILAGQLQPMYQDYFKKEIKPYLSQKIKYVGELTQKKLNLLYGKAKALLYPALWQEPFGLIIVEAMACGTPVIAFKKGSLPEIIKDKKTGFIVKDVNEMTKAVKLVDKIKRKDCRLRAEKYFTLQKMVNNYEKVYNEIIKMK